MPAPERHPHASRPPSDRLGMELALLGGALPVPASPLPATPGEEVTPRWHVLVADDDPDLRGYVRACLQDQCWITEAVNGADALAKAGRVRPSLIVTDALMPLVGGAGLCRALRADPALCTIPILAISGEAEALAGAGAFLPKPFTRQQLQQAVRALLTAP